DVQSILKSSQILAPPSAYAATCDSTEGRFTAAFVTSNLPSNSTIYLCTQSKSLGKVFLAQVLIHEALHLRGESDECAVTRLELEVMTRALRIPYKNAYVDSCGL
ncbi:MAG: hypothetical protein ABIR96_07815, partial [Bdellovibrionota bacterium]